MIDISVKNLTKAFEVNNNILDGLSFEINAGERVGLLGKNGAGKTTLFRLLVREYTEDSGDIHIASGKRIGLISQIPRYPDGYTTEDVLKTAHRRVYAIQDRLAELAQAMGDGADSAVFREYDQLTAELESLGGYNIDFERNRVANGLDIPADMRARDFAQLSGGEKTRVNLARLILEDTDILLLDEPTNHLDLRATEWLEDYLLKFKGTVLAISHDRYFLDKIAQRTIELVDGKAEFYSGGYSFYVEEKQRRFEEKMRQYEKDQAKIQQLRQAADKLHLWAFLGNDKLHKRAFSMEKRIEKLSQTERPRTERRLKAGFTQREFHGDEVLVMEGLSKSFGEKHLFSDLNLEITGGERIALIGENGAGKSTLIKLIMGEIAPDSGYVYRGPSVKTAYLPQIIQFDDPERSVLDTMLYAGGCTPQTARNRLGAFLFSGEDVFKSVSSLSGGEQSRLRLCMLMKDEINFLILDEPTNHLDISSREWIEAALSGYEEALLFVSHDRYFIERFATRLWVLENGKIVDFKGGYQEYCTWRARQAVFAQAAAKKPAQETKKTQKRGKLQADPEKLLAKVERDIAKAEAALKACDAQIEANATDYQKLMELEAEREPLAKALDDLYAQWEALAQ